MFKGFFKLLIPLLAFSVHGANDSSFTVGTSSLTNMSGATNLALGDDQVSSAINIGFDFDFYGNTFSQVKVATNGCITFGSGNPCAEYMSKTLPYSGNWSNGYDNTLFVAWSDYIRINSDASISYKTFDNSNFVVQWKNIQEYYNNATDNSFEVRLGSDDSIQYVYGDMDVRTHDLTIGLQGNATDNSGSSYDATQYLQHYRYSDSGSTVLPNTFEGVKLKITMAQGAVDLCIENPLSSSSCSGYASAYQNQQCELDSLYSINCTYYESALLDYECNRNNQYSYSCPGYVIEEINYGYQEPEYIDYGYVDPFYEDPNLMATTGYVEHLDPIEDCIVNPDFCYVQEIEIPETLNYFESQETFEPYEEFNIIEIYNDDIQYIDVIDSVLTFHIEEEFIFIEEPIEEIIDLTEEIEEEIEEFVEHLEQQPGEPNEPENRDRSETTEEREQIAENLEESMEQHQEIFSEVAEQNIEELIAEENNEPRGESSSFMQKATKKITETLTQSKSGKSDIGSNNTGVADSSSFSSGSVTAPGSTQGQVAQNTNLSAGGVDTGVQVIPIANTSVSSAIVSLETVEVQTVEIQNIETAVSDMDVVSTTTQTDEVEEAVMTYIADQQAEEQETLNEGGFETDQTRLVALMGYMPGWSKFTDMVLPDGDTWYESKSLYAGNYLPGNPLHSTFINQVNPLLATQGEWYGMDGK